MTAVDELAAPVVEAESVLITGPGAYTIPEDVYHADPVPGGSLSSTGARKLLPPSCPALFKHDRDHGQAPRRTFDFGHAAHRMVLGAGNPIEVVQTTAKDGTKSEAADRRTKSAQEHEAAIRDAGAVPLLREEYDRVVAMATALRRHPLAARLLDPALGKPEVSLFSVDQRTGVNLRARVDYLPDPLDPARLVLVDYKTTVSAEPRAVAKAVATYRYHQQAAWYSDVAAHIGLAPPDAITMRFVFQEKTAPHLVTVVELDDEALLNGRLLNRQAIDLYAECSAAGRWPGYTDEVELVSLPAYMTDDLDVI